MYLLFECGGSKTKIAVSDGQTIKDTQILPTPKSFDDFINTLQVKARELDNLEAVSGGMAVVFDKNRDLCIKSAHLQNWVGRELKKELEKVFNVPVFLENDTALGGLGEAVYGAGKNSNIVVFITVGTGIGGVKVVEGKLDKNLLGFEPGHQIITPDGNECSCGGKGHLEAYIGGSYLEKIYGQKSENIADSEIWDQITRFLAIGLYNSCVHWSPETIILGGSVIKSIPLEKLKKYLQEFSTIFPQLPELKLASLGEQSGVWGALELISQRNTIKTT